MRLDEMMRIQGDARSFNDVMEYRLEACGSTVYCGRAGCMFDDAGNYREDIEALLDLEICDVRAECKQVRGRAVPVLVITVEG